MNLSNSDTAATVDIRTRRGDTFYRRLDFKRGDSEEPLDGSTFRMQVRTFSGSELVTFSSADYITFSGGKLEIEVPASVMAGLRPDTYYFDLEQTRGNMVATRLAGSFTIVNDITHE